MSGSDVGLRDPLNLLWLTSAVALVLIYVRSLLPPTLEASSLLLFDEVPERMTESKLLNIDPLFWVELAALIALSLALAGPYLKMPTALAKGRHHALIFDVGAAMGARESDGTRLDEAKRRALSSISSAPAGDSFTVITYALEAELRRADSTDRRSLKRAVEALAPLAVPAGSAALSAALIRARTADVVELFVDRSPPGLPEGGPLAGRLHIEMVGSPRDNLAIASLDTGSVKATPGYCVVHNFSAQPHSCELRITVDSDVVFHRALAIEPRSQAVVPFGPLPRGGLVHARIVSPDALDADNDRYAYAPGESPGRALVLSPDRAVRDDLTRVLLAVNHNLLVTAADPGQFDGATSGGPFMLAAIHDAPDLKVAAASRLLIFPKALTSAAVKGTVEMAAMPGGGSGETFVPLGPARQLDLPPWMDVLLSGAAWQGPRSLPLIAVGQDVAGDSGIVAFDIRDHLLLDPDRLAALVKTVELVKALIEPPDLRIVATGGTLSLPSAGPAEMRLPDASTAKLLPDRWGRLSIRPLEAGRYEVNASGRRFTIFANYFDAEESDLGRNRTAAGPAPRAGAQASLYASPTTRVRPLDTVLVALGLCALLLEAAWLLGILWRTEWRHV